MELPRDAVLAFNRLMRWTTVNETVRIPNLDEFKLGIAEDRRLNDQPEIVNMAVLDVDEIKETIEWFEMTTCPMYRFINNKWNVMIVAEPYTHILSTDGVILSGYMLQDGNYDAVVCDGMLLFKHLQEEGRVMVAMLPHDHNE